MIDAEIRLGTLMDIVIYIKVNLLVISNLSKKKRTILVDVMPLQKQGQGAKGMHQEVQDIVGNINRYC